jgi:hypothetical protein
MGHEDRHVAHDRDAASRRCIAKRTPVREELPLHELVPPARVGMQAPGILERRRHAVAQRLGPHGPWAHAVRVLERHEQAEVVQPPGVLEAERLEGLALRCCRLRERSARRT